MVNPLRVLVTGTSGFLGKAIAAHLREGGATVVELTGRKDFERDVATAAAGSSAIVHAGFEVRFSPPGTEAALSANVANTRRLLEAAERAGSSHFVFLNAAGILGVSELPRARNEDDAGTTDSPFQLYRESAYIRDKLACRDLLTNRSFAVTDLLLTTVYGRDMNRIVTAPLRAAAESLSPVVLCPPGGTSYLHLDDFLMALSLVLESKTRGTFVLSSGNTTYHDLFETACEIAGTRWRKTFVSVPAGARQALKIARSLYPHLGTAVAESAFGFKYYSSERARRTFGWSPRRSLEDTIRAGLL